MKPLLVFSSGMARAQGVGSSGDIRGVVTDPAGRVIPKAAIMAEGFYLANRTQFRKRQ